MFLELDNIIEKLRCIKIAGIPLSAQLYAGNSVFEVLF